MWGNNRSKFLAVWVAVLLLSAVVLGVNVLGQRGVEAADRPQWEYLTVQYRQWSMLGEVLAEVVSSNDPAYDQLLFGDLICPSEIDAMGGACNDLFRGQAYYLNLWGQDGWELVSLNDKSTEYMYGVELIFKRPR